MTDVENLTPATAEDLADALMYALRFSRGKRVRSADDVMARITAERLVEYLEGAGFVVMKKPPLGGHSQLGRGYDGG